MKIFFNKKTRKILGLMCFSMIAVGLSLVIIAANPVKAAIPGAAGDGVVSPILGAYGASIGISVPDYYDLDPQLKLTYNSSGDNGFVLLRCLK
jgi:hypothetical protein